MTVAEIIAARDPSVVIDSRVNSLISIATSQTGSVFGEQRNYAIALLVLHWLELETRGGAAGAIASEKEGDLARSYAVNKKSIGELDSTKWGAELGRIRASLIFSPRNRTMP